jgi:hypothetical protein
MSRRGNCHDIAVAKSFFNLPKRKRTRKKVYQTRTQARQDVIKMFCNPTRKHTRNWKLSPVEFERQHKTQTEGVWKTRSDSRCWWRWCSWSGFWQRGPFGFFRASAAGSL